MKMKRILFFFCCIFALTCGIAGLSSCSDDDKFKVYVYKDAKWKSVEDVVGTLRYDDTKAEWLIEPDRRYWNPFTGGDEEGCVVIVMNWNDSYKEYSDGCIINGEYRLVKEEIDNHIEGIPLIVRYFELKITSISEYEIPPMGLSRSDGEIETPRCVVLHHNSDSLEMEMTTMNKAAGAMEKTVSSSLNVHIFIHVIRSTKGVGLNVYQVVDAITRNLNTFYEEAKISFQCDGYEYIDSDALNLITESSTDLVFSRNGHRNAIDIYVLSDGHNLIDIVGMSYNINSTACLIKKDHYLKTTVAHEVGHCLGLYHTHHGTYKKEGGTPELVNGSNSETAGDFVSDTPADPNRWSETTFGSDENGDPYNPDPSNIMSYYPFIEFRTKLTNGQLYRIHQQIHMGPVKACVTETPFTISGPQFIKTSADFSTNLSGHVEWTIDYKEYTGIGKYTSKLFSNSGSNLTINNPNTNAVSQRYDISALVSTPKGYKFKVSVKAYNTTLDPKCGSFEYSIDKPSKFGTIDLMSSTVPTLKIQRTGIVQFRYTDACGLSTDEISVNLWGNGFSQVSGYKNYYKCASNASLGVVDAPVNIICNGVSKMRHINFNVVAESATGYAVDAELMDTIAPGLSVY